MGSGQKTPPEQGASLPDPPEAGGFGGRRASSDRRLIEGGLWPPRRLGGAGFHVLLVKDGVSPNRGAEGTGHPIGIDNSRNAVRGAGRDDSWTSEEAAHSVGVGLRGKGKRVHQNVLAGRGRPLGRWRERRIIASPRPARSTVIDLDLPFLALQEVRESSRYVWDPTLEVQRAKIRKRPMESFPDSGRDKRRRHSDSSVERIREAIEEASEGGG